ncbi:hypothetical protein [Shouchella patagoniensis]|uniref:hypothetical protein n=1 Tax=Shouchella patagoniensis TaxID=228576 RepID=UPI000994D79B|nr:hypothetical protein [Shouchella patagoniensis]
MIDGSWVIIKRGTKKILGWIEKNKSFSCKDKSFQTYYFYSLEPERSQEPILIYQKDVTLAPVTLKDEDYHSMQLLALELGDSDWFIELGAQRREITF